MHITRETRRARQHLKSSCEEDVGSIDISICSGKAMGLRLILNQTRVLLSLFMPKSSVEHSAQTRFGEDAVTIKYILGYNLFLSKVLHFRYVRSKTSVCSSFLTEHAFPFVNVAQSMLS